MKKITISEFRAEPGEYLRAVEQGGQSFETLARRLRERAASNELHDLLREAAEWIEAYSEWSEVTERLLKQVATPPSRK